MDSISTSCPWGVDGWQVSDVLGSMQRPSWLGCNMVLADGERVCLGEVKTLFRTPREANETRAIYGMPRDGAPPGASSEIVLVRSLVRFASAVWGVGEVR